MKPIALLVLLLSAAISAAQRPFSRDHWLNESGTPVKVNALIRDARGYLWIGTDGGLYRFNGRNAVSIPDTINRPVTALAAAGDTIFCGYGDGAIRMWAGGHFTAWNSGGPQPSSTINMLAWRAGCLWACTDAQGIFAFANGKSHQLNSANGLSDDFTYTIAFGPLDALIATDRGITRLSLGKNGRWKTKVAGMGSGIPDNIVRTISTTGSAAAVFWGGCQDGGIFRSSPRSPTRDSESAPFMHPPAWPWGAVTDILPLSDDHAWAATEDGYLVECRFNGLDFELTPRPFPGKRFRRLVQDGTGGIWCGTGDGLTLITDNYLTSQSGGLPYSLSRITAMVFDRENSLYYNQGATLYRLPIGHPELMRTVLTTEAPVTTLHIDTANRLWIGTLGAGLWYHDSSGSKKVTGIESLRDGQILDITSAGNTLWVSCLGGVEEITLGHKADDVPAAVRHHGKHTGTGSDYVYQLYPDNRGRIWMATDGAGVCMYDGRKYTIWDSSSGLPGKVVYSITEDAAGNIRVATLDQGIYTYDGNTWQHTGRNDGLQDLNITAIAANSGGRVVVVHSKGFDQWHPDNKIFRHFNRRLGMGIDSQSNALNCYATDTAGNVWAPFEHGFICFRASTGRYDLRPGIAIREALLFFKHLPAGAHSFNAADNHIGFRFEGINFTNPERLLFRYRLNGYDTGWVYTNDESVTFPQLPPGSYRFCVQSSLSPDFSQAASAEYDVHIAAPVWKQKWAIGLAIAILIGAAWAYLKLRERVIRRTALLQRERMMAEYEQLKSQVNPHFLFNSLNTLAGLIEEDSATAVKYTIHLSDFYRSILTYKDRDLIYLSEERSLLMQYIYIQQSRFGDCLIVDVQIPEEIATTRQIVPLALQLLVENAIKHNIVSTANPLRIYIYADGTDITVRNALNPKISKEPGAGMGLANISRRYLLMSSRQPTFGGRDGAFIVTLPLL